MRRMSFAGLLGAAAGATLSVSPSLIPRAALIQGLLAGVLAAIGYGLGALCGWLLRTARRRPDWRTGRSTRRITCVCGVALVSVALVVGRSWQANLAAVTGTPPPGGTWVAVAAASGCAVFVLLLACARSVRWLTRRLAGRLQRVAPPRVATASAVSFSLLLGVAAVDRLPEATATALSPLFRVANAATPAGVQPPTSDLVSGGHASAIPWADLGAQGRTFVAGVTSAADLRAWSGTPARNPIRVFIGVDSSETAAGRAQRAVAELERFGAFDRAVVAIGISAGPGVVDPGEVVALEYLLNGDVATVSTQYSILPSFLSFMVDRPTSVSEAQALLEGVRERVGALPASDRPRVVVFGESLGAYGASGTFTDLRDLRRRSDGAMFQGPPNATPLWRRYTEEREPGTPEHLPVYDGGRHLRWANQPSDLAEPSAPFLAPRAVFLQNASDPVVWWSPDLLWSRPDWLAEPRGPGVLNWPWLPLVTFAGLTGDLMNSQGVPPGHGHMYGTDTVVAWADILRPPGWTSRDSARLTAHLTG